MWRVSSMALSLALTCSGVGPRSRAAMKSSHAFGGERLYVSQYHACPRAGRLIHVRTMRPPGTNGCGGKCAGAARSHGQRTAPPCRRLNAAGPRMGPAGSAAARIPRAAQRMRGGSD